MTNQHFPTVDFLVRLRKIDKACLTGRDILSLYAIISHPGSNGKSICNMIGIPNRSNVQDGLARLIRYGLVEDRRKEIKKAIPNCLYVTQEGIAFWNDLKS